MTMTDHCATFGIIQERRTKAKAHAPRHLSQVLSTLACHAGPRITVNQIVDAIKDRSFGAFLVVFALPNLIPLPPGSTLVLGVPLMVIAWQMMMSKHQQIWLPRRVGEYAFDTASFSQIVHRITPWIERVERLVKPRMWFLRSRLAERLVGALALLLAIIVFLPIPFGNWLPALALAVIGFAQTERDGAGLIAGVAIGIASLFIAGIVVCAAGALLAFLF